MKKTLLFFLYISFNILSFAQKDCMQLFYQAQKSFLNKEYGKALSLLNKGQKCTHEDSTLIKIYDLTGKIYSNLERYPQAIRYFLQKEHFLNKNLNSKTLNELYNTEITLGNLHEKLDEYNIAVDYFIKALSIAYRLNNKTKIALAYEELGECYENLNFYDKALSNYFTSYKNYKKLNSKEKEIEVLLKIANIYRYKGEYKAALESYYTALELAQKLSKNNQSQIYLAIAELLYNLKFYSQAQKYLVLAQKDIKDSILLAKTKILKAKILIADSNLNKAEQILNETLNFLSNKDKLLISDIYDLLGIINFQKGQMKKSHRYMLMAYNIRMKSNDMLRKGESYANLGLYFLHNRDTNLAQIYFLKAFQTFSSIKNYQELSKISLYLAQLFKYLGDYPQAYKYLDIYRRIEDSVIHTNQVDILQKLDEKNKITLEKELIRQRLNIIKKYNKYLSIGLLFLLILGLFLVYQTVKNYKKNKELGQQKQALEDVQKHLQKQNIFLKRLYIATYFSNNSIFITKPDGTITWFNRMCKQIYNLDKNTLGQNLKKLSSYPQIEEVYKVVNNKKNAKYINYHIVNGKKIWLQTLMTPLVVNGKVLEIIGIETNITKYIYNTLKIHHQQKLLLEQNLLLEKYNKQLKQQQLELKEKNEELQQQQEELKNNAEILEQTVNQLKLFSTVLKYIDNFIYLIDENKNLVWWNKSLSQKLNISFQIDSKSKNITDHWIKTVFENSKDFTYYFEKAITTKRSYTFIYQQNFEDDQLWLQTTMTPILNKEKEVSYIAIIQSDISILKQTEEKLAEKNKELISSMEYAKKIQEAILPMHIFMEALFYKNYFIFMRPRDIVSGDFYWARSYKGKTLLAIADATGHGIPAAFISLIGTMAMNAVIDKIKDLNASAFLAELKETISLILHQRGKKDEARDSIDLAFCIFDFNNKSLEFAGAYIPLYLLRKKTDTQEIEIITLKENKNTIGFDMHKSAQFKSHKVKLQHGDMIYISTDGFMDQFGGNKNKKFKRKRFLSLLKQIYPLPVYDQRNKIKTAFYEWKRNNPQIDDVLVFGLKIDENLM